MFGRGNWAVFAINPEQLSAFQESLNDPKKMLDVSQFSASAVTRVFRANTAGINPFGAPRQDERYNPDEMTPEFFGNLITAVADLKRADEAEAPAIREALPAQVLNFFGSGETAYRIVDVVPLYGFWFVENTWKDVTDLASKREGIAYDRTQRPFKFLTSGEKKAIEAELKGEDAAQRKQYPVFLDFNTGRCFIECTSATSILTFQYLLKEMGLESAAVAWSFGDSLWPEKFLGHVFENSFYKTDFQKRAEEAKRHTASSIEPLDDPILEGIVSDYFATAQLDSEQWASLSVPAAIRVFPSDPIVVQSPPAATVLLNHENSDFPKATLAAAAVDFQEVGSYFRKGEEKVYRRTVFSLTINDVMNDLDAGIALLRGFDLPSFGKDMRRDIKKGGVEASVPVFWAKWYSAMTLAIEFFRANIVDALDISRDEPTGLVKFMASESEDGDEVNV